MMNTENKLRGVVAITASAAVAISVLVGCNNKAFVVLGLIPPLEVAVLLRFPGQSNAINFIFGLLRLFLLLLLNKRPYSLSSPAQFDYLDVVTIFLLSPSTLMDKRKNMQTLFLFVILLRSQRLTDDGDNMFLRLALKFVCFFTFSIVGFTKSFIQERLHSKLMLHFALHKKMTDQKKILSKAYLSAVGWEPFSKNEYTADTSFFSAVDKCEELGEKNTLNEIALHRLLRSVILKDHDSSKFRLIVQAAQSYKNVKRMDCILIAIKPFVDNTLTYCEAQNVYDVCQISKMINDFAKSHRVTIVRKFGDIWIGCVGFFPTEGREISENVSDILGMAKDVYVYGLKNSINFTCALGCGNICCGFFRGVFEFEVLGPEVMWMLSVCEFENDNHIYVSDSLHSLCKRLQGKQYDLYKFDNVLLDYVDKSHTRSSYTLVLDKGIKNATIMEDVNSQMVAAEDLVKDKASDSSYCLVDVDIAKGRDEVEVEMAPSLLILHCHVCESMLSRIVIAWKRIKILVSRVSAGSVPIVPVHSESYVSELFRYTSGEQVNAGSRLFDSYPRVDCNFGTKSLRLAKQMLDTMYRKLGLGYLGRCVAKHAKSTVDFTNAQETSELLLTNEYEKLEEFRRMVLMPTSYLVGCCVLILLMSSIWAILYVGDEGLPINALSIKYLSTHVTCVFIVMSFFNWVIPVVHNESLLLLICNVIWSLLYPICGVGDALGAMAILPTWMILCYSHSLCYVAMSTLTALLVFLVRHYLVTCTSSNNSVLFFLLGLFFLMAVVLLEYYIYMCFFVERVMIPYEESVIFCYDGEIKNIFQQTRAMFLSRNSTVDNDNDAGEFVPSMSTSLDTVPHRFKCYQKCVIIVVHVKAMETFPDIGSVDHVSNILEYIYGIFDNCADNFRITGMCKFSGVHMSVIRDDEGLDGSNLRRGVAYVQYILKKFRELDQELYINLKIGLCLNYGPLNIGMFEDNSHAYFDVTGGTRDKAVKMAVRNENDIFFSAIFLSEMKLAFPNKNFKRVVEGDVVTGPHAFHPSPKWYQLEIYDAFSFAGNFGFSRNMKDYVYVETLGKGGAGTVHLLEDQVNKVQVAVKVIEWNPATINHIRRELIILQELKHQNIVKIKFFVIKRAEVFIVMEYIRGGTLQQIVDFYSIDLERLRVWFMQLVLALEYIHERGIIHRDVKPSNCMIDTFGVLKLTDFGLALQEIDNSVKRPNASKKKENEGHALDAASLKLLQTIFPSSVQYNTAVGGSNRPKVGILLIDDDRYRLENTQSLLRQHFIVYSVNTDDEALDFLNHSIKDNNHANDICLIIISIDTSGEQFNGWGFLNTFWTTELLKDIPVIALASTVSSNPEFSNIWEERLPKIPERPKLIINHPFNSEAYEANRYYFDMVCRLEKQRKHFGKAEASVFDKIVSETYHSKRQLNNPSSQRESFGPGKNDITRSKKGSAAGTLCYMAPEVLNKEECNEKIDWWACGATFYYCVMGRNLFDRRHKHLIVKDILYANVRDKLSLCRDSPPELKDLMQNMLLRDVDSRFGASAIKNHVYFEGVGVASAGAVKKLFDPISQCKLRNNATPGPVDTFKLASERASFRVTAEESTAANDNRSDEHGQFLPRMAYSDTRLRNRWTMDLAN